MIPIIYNIFVFAIIFIVYIYGTHKFTQKLAETRQKNFIWLLFLVHSLFTMAFYLYSTNSASDADAYYKAAFVAEDWFSLFGMGANFMRFISYPFTKLQLSYFNINLLFSIFGLFGFYNLYYLLIKNAYTDNSKIYWGANVLLLLPTFHFYTSGISKDNLIFFSITTILIYIYQNKIINLKFLFTLVFIFLIRSYLFIFLLTSYGVYLLFLSKIQLVKRLSIMLVGIVCLILIEPIISTKLNIEIFSMNNIDLFLTRVQSFGTNSRLGGSIIDAANMSIFRRMFTYSYLPLIWESNSILKHLTSFENFLLLIILVKFLFSRGKYKFFKQSNLLIKFTVVFSLLTWFVLSFTLYNLGLSTRQKYMYIPYLYFIIFIYFEYRSKSNTVIDSNLAINKISNLKSKV